MRLAVFWLLIATFNSACFGQGVYKGLGINKSLGTAFDPMRLEFQTSRWKTIDVDDPQMVTRSDGEEYLAELDFVSDWSSYTRAQGLSVATGYKFLSSEVRASYSKFKQEQIENRTMFVDLYVTRKRTERLRDINSIKPDLFEENILETVTDSKSIDNYYTYFGSEIVNEREVEVGLVFRLKFHFQDQSSMSTASGSLSANVKGGRLDSQAFSSLYQHSKNFSVTIQTHSWGITPNKELAQLVDTLETDPSNLSRIVQDMNEVAKHPNWSSGRTTRFSTVSSLDLIPFKVVTSLTLSPRAKIKNAILAAFDSKIEKILDNQATLNSIRPLIENPLLSACLSDRGLVNFKNDSEEIEEAIESIYTQLASLENASLDEQIAIIQKISINDNFLIDYRRYFDENKIKEKFTYSGWDKTKFMCLYPSDVDRGHCNLRLFHEPSFSVANEVVPLVREILLYSETSGELERVSPTVLMDRIMSQNGVIARRLTIKNYNCRNVGKSGAVGEENSRKEKAEPFSEETASMKPKIIVKLVGGLEDIVYEFQKNW